MSRKQAQRQRLIEVSALVGALTEKMMTAYAVGAHPTEAEVKAFCQGVLLLEEHAAPLPAFAEDVIGRLQAEDALPAAPPTSIPAASKPAPPPRRSVLDWLLRPLGTPRAA